MRLGTKFVLLIVGTLAAPVLTGALMALLVIAGTPNGIGPAESIRTVLALHGLRSQRKTPAEVSSALRAVAPDNEFLVLDADQRPLFSTFPVSLQDMVLDPKWQSNTFTRIPLQAPDGSRFFVIVAFHVSREPARWLGSFSALIVAGSLVGFLVLMSIVIIRSINRSIARLEEGTRRISAGDLDFALPVEGGGDSIASLTRAFDEMRRRVKDAAEARSRFIMSVSHDLKTPLSSITGYLDAIEDGLAREPGQQRRYLAIIRDKAGLLESRISQLIDYVKLETGEWTRSREPTALAAFLRETVTVFASEAEVRGFTLETVLDVPESTIVSMDADLVSRALENLVQNAFRYATQHTTLRFSASPEGSCVVLRITNQGTIGAADLPFIFEPFYRGSRSRREAGFGLGLAVVKWVISSHGWTLEASSGDGSTTFTIGIPLLLGALPS